MAGSWIDTADTILNSPSQAWAEPHVESLRSRCFFTTIVLESVRQVAAVRLVHEAVTLWEMPPDVDDRIELHRNGRVVSFTRRRRGEESDVVIERDCFPRSIVPDDLRRERIVVPSWSDIDGLAAAQVRLAVELLLREK